MEDDEDHQGEMIGEGAVKQVWGSNEDEEAILEGAEHGWDRKRKSEEFSGGVDRRKKETRNQFGAAYVIPDGLEPVQGSGFAEKDHTKIDRRQGRYGMLVLPNGKVMKLREKSLQKLGLMMNEGDDNRMGTAGEKFRPFRNTSNSEGIETTPNAIPREGKSGYRGTWGKQYTPGVSFEGKVESLEGYPMNKGRRSDKRGVGVASGFTGIVTSRDHANGTNMKILVNRANSQMFEQWAGSLKPTSSATSKKVPFNETNETNDSLSSIRRPSIMRAAAKVGSRLMRIRGKENSPSHGYLSCNIFIQIY